MPQPERATFAFGSALVALKGGLNVARAHWGGWSGDFLVMVYEHDTNGTLHRGKKENTTPKIGRTSLGKVMTKWETTDEDLLAEDWVAL